MLLQFQAVFKKSQKYIFYFTDFFFRKYCQPVKKMRYKYNIEENEYVHARTCTKNQQDIVISHILKSKKIVNQLKMRNKYNIKKNKYVDPLTDKYF